MKTIRITHTDSNFEREPLVRPFGFKGGYLTELWQVASRLQSESGTAGVGLATQSVLYGDAMLFERHSESGGNALMYALTEQALRIARGRSFSTPVELLDGLLPEVTRLARQLTDFDLINTNFALNALISVDNAAWLLYAAENGYKNFDAMIPDAYRPALGYRNDKVAVMFQVPYGMPVSEIVEAVRQGYFVIKIKTGAPGSQAEMLQKDMDRLALIHAALKDLRTDQTANGKILYTMDANARYERKETLERYLDRARRIGAFDHILVMEEPLSESNEEAVGDLGCCVAADESIHTEADALQRLELGYQALVLKGIAKTLSLSLKIAALAEANGAACFCADLTVNPILIDWNKNLAARVKPFPGLGMGMLETNGDMNYRNWPAMKQYAAYGDAPWTVVQQGAFQLDDNYYARSGGIFDASEHYNQLITSTPS